MIVFYRVVLPVLLLKWDSKIYMVLHHIKIPASKLLFVLFLHKSRLLLGVGIGTIPSFSENHSNKLQERKPIYVIDK